MCGPQQKIQKVKICMRPWIRRLAAQFQKFEKYPKFEKPEKYFHVFESFLLFEVVFEIGIESGVIFHAYRNF